MQIDLHDIITPDISKIFETLGEENVRFIGGVVRDKLRNVINHDIDLATVFEPKDVLSKLATRGLRTIKTGMKHGTVTVASKNGGIEITTLRRDVSCDGRHALVEFSNSWEEDAMRRDFTINAIYADVNGKIYDYVGGLNDLQDGIIRFIGDTEKRITEDYLRILRFFRFYGLSADFTYLHEDMDMISRLAGGLDQISGERIRTEMYKILLARNNSIQLMQKAGVMGRISMYDTPIIEEYYPTSDPLPNLAYLLIEGGAAIELLYGIRSRWKLSNKDYKTLKKLIEINLSGGLSDSHDVNMYVLGKQLYVRSLKLQQMRARQQDRAAVCNRLEEEIKRITKMTEPRLPVTGGDLIEGGIKPDKEMGILLKKAEKYWLSERCLPTREELLSYIKSMVA